MAVSQVSATGYKTGYRALTLTVAYDIEPAEKDHLSYLFKCLPIEME